MSIQRIGVGNRMSEAVVHADTVYLSGQIGEGHTLDSQAHSMLASIEAVLSQAGTSKSNLISVTVWLADINDYEDFNVIWDAWIDRENLPARACVQATLASSAYLVEASVVALKP